MPSRKHRKALSKAARTAPSRKSGKASSKAARTAFERKAAISLTPAKLIEKVTKHVLGQVERDHEYLKALPHAEWYKRVRKSVRSFIPDLIKNAAALMREVEETLNSPQNVRETWRELHGRLKAQGLSGKLKGLVIQFDSELRKEEGLTKVNGTSVSSVIAEFWKKIRPDMSENSPNNYPDMFFNFSDYSGLPMRTRTNVDEPAVKGKERRPSNVPDGMEIKSQRGKRVRVDAHHMHRGMHLALTFSKEKGRWVVHDVLVAYLSEGEYKHRARNTPASTDKFSFGHEPFISAVTGETLAVVEEIIEAEPETAGDEEN